MSYTSYYILFLRIIWIGIKTLLTSHQQDFLLHGHLCSKHGYEPALRDLIAQLYQLAVGFGHISRATGMARDVLTKHTIHSRLPPFTG
jgi:hypothetical protein